MKLKSLLNEIDFNNGKITHISKNPLLHLTYGRHDKSLVPNTEQDKQLIIASYGEEYGYQYDNNDPNMRALRIEDLPYLFDDYNVLITT